MGLLLFKKTLCTFLQSLIFWDRDGIIGTARQRPPRNPAPKGRGVVGKGGGEALRAGEQAK